MSLDAILPPEAREGLDPAAVEWLRRLLEEGEVTGD
jgi:hypothetical protein